MKLIPFALTAALAVLAGCQQGPAPASDTAATTATTAAKPLLTVNGTPVSEEFFDFYVKNVAGKPAAELTAEERTRALDSLARIYALTQAAEKDGALKDPETASRLELSRLSVVQAAAAQHYLKDKTRLSRNCAPNTKHRLRTRRSRSSAPGISWYRAPHWRKK